MVTPSQVNAPLSLAREREKIWIFREKTLVAPSQVNAPLSLKKRRKSVEFIFTVKIDGLKST